mmetsp:Transcript_14040/g.42381  ORF Transcript_14040/g.42381 Transcript_14040/m.42381 type:complete len:239 (-) Transcript_14040:1148-1864(-)
MSGADKFAVCCLPCVVTVPLFILSAKRAFAGFGISQPSSHSGQGLAVQGFPLIVQELHLQPDQAQEAGATQQQDLQSRLNEEAQAARARAVTASIVSGEPHTERKSTFQAHVAPVTCKEDVELVMAALLSNNKIQRASHNMMAYRIWSQERQLFDQDCDDDGESAAGGRLLHLLEIMNVQDVVVVVSRWFGGVLLGPQRFTIINNTARLMLEACGYDNRHATKSGPTSKPNSGGLARQ